MGDWFTAQGIAFTETPSYTPGESGPRDGFIVELSREQLAAMTARFEGA